MINFEETELRLGLPGGTAGNGNDVDGAKSNGKRGFSETVDLKLNLSTKETGKGGDQEKVAMKEKAVVAPRPNDPAKPPSK
ncbi:hypothetical protein OIU84_006576 [Salix udensis]|uniref:Uncharacterized protein n=1 Tax=Salix udensis TaxID=889485 RepID=A0AAD6P2D6_9ROSI|nr:hypothetical protein OIU84_006576 [Salix udensis]